MLINYGQINTQVNMDTTLTILKKVTYCTTTMVDVVLTTSLSILEMDKLFMETTKVRL